MAPLLHAKGISAFYGRVEAVRDISIKVEAGQVATIIGANGAGKTTLLHALMGLVTYRGLIEFEGASLSSVPVEARVDRGLSLVPETRALFADMTVLENLELGAFPRYRRGEKDIYSDLGGVFARFPRLAERKDQRAGSLSGGERQMLAIGRALMSRPKLLLLDEPSLGLAPLMVIEVFKVLTQMRKMNVSVLLVEQNARAALRIADYGYVLETGSLVTEGAASALTANPQVAASYLGFDDDPSASASLR